MVFLEEYQYVQLKLGKFQLAVLVYQRVEVVFFPKLWIFPVPKNQQSNPPKKRGGSTSIARGVFVSSK